jgi:hypothetical protein
VQETIERGCWTNRAAASIPLAATAVFDRCLAPSVGIPPTLEV